MLALLTATLLGVSPSPESQSPPNVIVIMTDDQGYGDLGFHGNPILRTPNIDALAERSARMETFYVSPVCTPTRAALMTGRYCQRTTAIDTYIGRAMLSPDEVTIAELLRDAGWATGIFGKWHLGDCYPMRAMDQGFEMSLVHRGGGIGQPSDPEGGERKYTDAVLFHNGERVETTGYCTDVYFDAAIEWMKQQHDAGRPFFTYLSMNAPHGPYHDVPEDLLAYYQQQPLVHDSFPQDEGHPLEGDMSADVTARIFAMIENIDQNVGTLVSALDEMGVTRNTLILYLQDNGPQQRRYTNGMQGWKGQVYDGGVRSPLFAHWPGTLEPGVASDRISAHIDLLPTILDVCGVALPDDITIDGRSILPLLRRDDVAWPDRTLFIQAHRGDAPIPWRNTMVRTQRWKLVNDGRGFGGEFEPGQTVALAPELYDMERDPFELHDVSADHPDAVERLTQACNEWFDDVGGNDPSRYEPPPIIVGAPESPRVVLTRQDWRRADWGGGAWLVDVRDDGLYNVRVRFREADRGDRARIEFRIGATAHLMSLPAGHAEVTFERLTLPRGQATFAFIMHRGDEQIGAYQVTIEPLN